MNVCTSPRLMRNTLHCIPAITPCPPSAHVRPCLSFFLSLSQEGKGRKEYIQWDARSFRHILAVRRGSGKKKFSRPDRSTLPYTHDYPPSLIYPLNAAIDACFYSIRSIYYRRHRSSSSSLSSSLVELVELNIPTPILTSLSLIAIAITTRSNTPSTILYRLPLLSHLILRRTSVYSFLSFPFLSFPFLSTRIRIPIPTLYIIYHIVNL